MFYLFHGQDTYSQREFLAGLLAKEGDADMVSLNTTRLSGKVTFNELQSACDAVPFLAVSYTHLDVYKRQVRPPARDLPG